MKLFALIAVTMCAFAANSVLSRLGIFTYQTDAFIFSGVRLASGALMLALVLRLRGTWPKLTRARSLSGLALLIYLVPFSFAYITLPSGVGALILFGVVQVTMFAGSAIGGVTPTARQWVGMGMAMAGLIWLLMPSDDLRLDLAGVASMTVAGIGWGVFSLRGRGSKDPLGDITMSFVLLLPVAVLLTRMGGGWTPEGVLIACVSGAVTSGLGYALWYRVLPQIAATTGAVAQLSVPVIALIAGAALLSETVTMQIVLASVVVLGGIAVSVLKRA